MQAMIKSYINNELNNNELEFFLEAISNSKELQEELEIYYIIEVGLKEEARADFNVKKELEEKIKNSYVYLNRLRLLKIVYYAINTLLFIGTTLLILLQVRILWQGGYL